MAVVQIATHIGFFTLFLFFLSSILGSLIFMDSAPFGRKETIANHTYSRYDLLKKHLGNMSGIARFIVERENSRQIPKVYLYLAEDYESLKELFIGTELYKLTMQGQVPDNCLVETIGTGNMAQCGQTPVPDNIINQASRKTVLLGETSAWEQVFGQDNFVTQEYFGSSIQDSNWTFHIISHEANKTEGKLKKKLKNDSLLLILAKRPTLTLFAYRDEGLTFPNKGITFTNNTTPGSVNDLAATLATIMSLPIPFTNLGVLVPELMVYPNCGGDASCLFELLFDYIVNYLQILTYLSKLSSKSTQFLPLYIDLKTTFEFVRPDLATLFEDYSTILRLEENNSTHLQKYRAFTKQCTDLIHIFRQNLTETSASISLELAENDYDEVAIAVLIKFAACVTIAATILMLLQAKEHNIYAIVRNYLTSVFAPLIASVLSLLAYFIPKARLIIGIFGLLVALGAVAYKGYLIRSRFAKIKQAVKTVGVAPFITGFTFMIFHILVLSCPCFVFARGTYCLNKNEIDQPINYVLTSGIIVIAILLHYKRVDFFEPYFWTLVASLITSLCGDLRQIQDKAVAFIVFSAVPMVVLSVIFIFFLMKRTYSVRILVKLVVCLLIALETVLISYCHYAKFMEEQVNSEEFMHELVYGASLLQVLVTILGTFFPRILFFEIPTLKHERVSTVYTLLFVSLTPSVLLYSGPNTQIAYCAALIANMLTIRALREANQANSIFYCTLYSLSLHHVIYSVSPLDSSFILKLIGPIVVLHTFMPILTIHASRVEFAQLEAVKFVRATENLPEINKHYPEVGGEPERMSATVASDFLYLLLFCELIHAVLMIIAGTSEAMRSVEEQYSVVNAAAYISIFANSFIIGHS